MASNSRNKHRVFLVTGFGAFSGITDNPTQQIIAVLKERLPSMVQDQVIIPIHYDVLEVSVDFCNQFIHETFPKLRTMLGENDDHSEKEIICVHLGVDGRGNFVKLEQTAYNNMTFRVPDYRGFQPEQQCINSNLPWDEGLSTNWDLEALRQPMTEICLHCKPVDAASAERCPNGEYQVNISTDPGRYLCNYIYYRTLSLGQEVEAEGIKMRPLFVHVPQFEIIDKDTQINLVETLLKKMVELTN